MSYRISGPELPMKAKCPHCFGESESGECDKCKGGLMEVGFATGLVHTQHCVNPKCGFDNGIHIGELEGPPPTSKCVACGSEGVVWLHIGEVKEEEDGIRKSGNAGRAD